MKFVKVKNPNYAEATGYLYRKTGTREQLTRESTFPCVVQVKENNCFVPENYAKKQIYKEVIVVALHGNQLPYSYLNCKIDGYPHSGMHYSSYEIIGYPVIDKTTGEYIRTKPWKNYHKRGIVAIIGDIVKSIKKRIE